MTLSRIDDRFKRRPELSGAVASNGPALQREYAGSESYLSKFATAGVNALIIAILSPFAALSSDISERILLAVLLLDIPFQFGTHFYYSDYLASTGALGGLSFSSTTIALMGLYISWFLRSRTSRVRAADSRLVFNSALLIFLAIDALSILVAQNASLAFYEVFLSLQYYLVYLYIANNVRSRRDISFIVSFLLFGGIIESLAMIVLSFTGMPSSIGGLPTHIHMETAPHATIMRVGGTVGSPNETAAYLGFLIALSACLFFTTPGRSLKWQAVAFLGIGGIAEILTFSRGGWTAAVVAVFLICFLIFRRRKVSSKLPILILVLVGVVYLPFHGLISKRIMGDDKGSAESRIPLMSLAFRMIETHPLLGVGSNNFSVAMYDYVTSEFRKGFLYAVHDKYLLIWTETGTGGLLAYLAFLIGAVRKGWLCFRKGNQLPSILALGIMAGIIGHMIHMNVELFRIGPVQELLWLFAALLIPLYRLASAPPPGNTVGKAA